MNFITFGGNIIMKKTLLIFVVLLLLATLNGVPFTSMGGFNIPSARVLPHKMMEVSVIGSGGQGLNGFEKETTETGGTVFDADQYDVTFAGMLNIGLYDRVEIAAIYDANHEVLANLKIQLFNETESRPAIAFGINNLFSPIKDFRDWDDEEMIDEDYWVVDENGPYAYMHPGDTLATRYSINEDYQYQDIDDYIENSWYFVISKSVVWADVPFLQSLGIDYLESVMHLGLGQGKFVGNVDFSKKFNGLFGGIEAKISDKFSAFAEIDGHNLNIGGSVSVKKLTVSAGMYRLEEVFNDVSADPKFALSVKYAIDAWSELKYDERNHIERTGTGTTSSVPSGRRTVRQGKKEVQEQTGANPLLQELEAIRAKRKEAEKELEAIKSLLEEEE